MFNMRLRAVRFSVILRVAAIVSFLTSIIIIIKILGQTGNRPYHHNDTFQSTKGHMPNNVRHVTEYVYVNKTVIVFKERDLILHGPGENGTAVKVPEGLLSNETLDTIKENEKLHGFNTLISDIVSLHRKVPDMRSQTCKGKVYPDNLPPVSVVIIFRDEWHSILLRTAYSVLENSPPDMIKEVILVDDGSVDNNLKAIVNVHVSTVEKFRLVTNDKPLGLMMARQKGIEATTADYFIAMDGHMEVGPGWLEPLINRLVEEPNACLCSHISSIRREDLSYAMKKKTHLNFATDLLVFDPFTMAEQWVSYRQRYRNTRNNSVEPLEYAMVQGMQIAMRKAFFLQLGGFDPGMKVWGSEQIEMSVKVWLCGGRVEKVPCSKVAHMYRHTQWGRVIASSDHMSTNKRRTVDVWMNEQYRTIVMDNLRDKHYETGDLTKRHTIRKQNNCKPYQYFVDKVNELTDMFFPTYFKTHRNVYNKYKDRCLDIETVKKDKYKLILYGCHNRQNQNLMLTDRDQIRSAGFKILNAKSSANTTNLSVDKKVENIYTKESYWDYRDDNTIYHRASGLCLTALTPDTVGLMKCSEAPSQVWEWKRETNVSRNVTL